MNKFDGTADYVELIPIDNWGRMAEKNSMATTAIDLAFLPFLPNQTVFDFSPISIQTLLSNETSVKHSIGVGDELFVVGLFTLHYGKQRNIPIVRTGIISAMFQEPLLDRQNRPYTAYLAEMRSIGGLSGSPVFVMLNRQRVYSTEFEVEADWAIYLLGLIRGHWDLKRDLSADAGNETQDIFLGYSKGENLNVGIAVITPSQYLVTLLTHPAVVEERKKQIIDIEQQNQLTEDSVIIEENSDEISFSDEMFHNALKKASRKTSELEKETKETSE